MTGQISATQLLERVAPRAQRAEVYEVRGFRRPVVFRSGALESVKAVESAGRALRVVQGDRLGFSTTTDMADGTTVVQNALAAAQFGDPAPFEFPSTPPSETVRCFDPAVEQLDERGLIALGEEIVARVQAYSPELQVDITLTRTTEDVHLLNSAGLDVQERRTALTISAAATLAREGDILVVSEGASSRRLQEVGGLAMAERIVERLRWSERIAQVEAKAMPVVFRLYATMALLLPFVVGLNGRSVYLNTSPLGGRLGEQAFDPRFTLVDNGRLAFAMRSASFDDEGVPTSAKPLVERGVIRQFMFDLKTAAQVGAPPTGNGYRSEVLSAGDFRRPPTVDTSSWVVPPGEQSLEQILAGLDEALWVEDVLGLGQGNFTAGEFSNNIATGFLVRRGEIVGRVKNTMVAGNVYELLKDRLIGLSDQPEWSWKTLYTPAIVLDGVGVVG